jgi:hypothetical protein
MTVVKLSPDEMRGFAASEARNPGIARLNALIREHVLAQGGVALEVWRLHLGQIFGEPVMMTPDEVAKQLGFSVSEVTSIIEETRKAVRPLWFDTPEYKASPFADM